MQEAELDPFMMPKRRRDSGRNIHMYWPYPLGARIQSIAERRGMTMTQVVVRVLAHAEATNIIEDWLTEPPPPDLLSPRGAATK